MQFSGMQIPAKQLDYYKRASNCLFGELVDVCVIPVVDNRRPHVPAGEMQAFWPV